MMLASPTPTSPTSTSSSSVNSMSMRWSRRIVQSLTLALTIALAACGSPAPAGVAFHAEGAPPRLGDWNVLRIEGGRLRPNARVEPYALNAALFSDYAHKYRTLWMPPGAKAKYDASATFEFPVGTIITKTFYYPKAPGGDTHTVLRAAETAEESADGIDLAGMRLIETRVLVRRQDGWAAIPYVWNSAQTEAELAREGETLRLDMRTADGASRTFAYLVPDENQCASCHADDSNSREVRPIGPKSRHLDRDDPWRPGRNQFARLIDAGLIDRGPPAGTPRNARYDDRAASIEARARAYLDINCGHCHSTKGPADTSGLWLDAPTNDATRLGLCKPPVAAGQGTGDRVFDIVPGEPDASILVYRTESDDPGAMMPEIGRSLVHEEGVALLREWIGGWQPAPCVDAEREDEGRARDMGADDGGAQSASGHATAR